MSGFTLADVGEVLASKNVNRDMSNLVKSIAEKLMLAGVLDHLYNISISNNNCSIVCRMGRHRIDISIDGYQQIVVIIKSAKKVVKKQNVMTDTEMSECIQTFADLLER